MNDIHCIILDDEKTARERMVLLLKKFNEVKIVSIESEPEEAIKSILAKKPEIVFLDVEMPRMSGFDVVTEIKAAGIRSTIIFVTGYNQYAIKAIKAAAFDFLVKPVDIDELKDCIDRFKSESRPQMRSGDSLKSFNLSEREIEVLQLIVQGKTSKEIANLLFISKNTVDTHRRNILSKTELRNTKELILNFLNKNTL